MRKQNIPSKEVPLVSVVIPTMSYRGVLLDRALSSVSKQTYENIEIIIISDDTISAPAARNQGIEKAKGKYIAFLDDDDEWDKTKIAMQVAYMQDNPDCGLCTSWAHDMRFNMNRVSMPMPDPEFMDLIKSFNLSSTSSYMIRASALAKSFIMQRFDENLVSGQEYDLALTISLLGWKIHTIQRILMKQHATENQISVCWNKKITGQFQFVHKWHRFFSIKEYIKTIGLMALFALGFIVGVRIYKFITKAKEMYEA